MNANIIETQFFHKKKHDIDHKGQEGHIRQSSTDFDKKKKLRLLI